jgi:hypothetical protein
MAYLGVLQNSFLTTILLSLSLAYLLFLLLGDSDRSA